MLGSLLDPIFSPLLKLSPFWTVLVISLITTALITFIYKLMTNQELMKSMKGEIKQHQKKMKELKDQPQKMMAEQKKAMEKNMKYMMHSLKPTLITFIPIILIFGWLNANLDYHPISPGEEFTAQIEIEDGNGEVILEAPNQLQILSSPVQQTNEGTSTWKLKGPEGRYVLNFKYDNQEYSKKVIISDQMGNYAQPKKKLDDGLKVTVEHQKVQPLGSVSIFGWHPGWLGTYIILSLVFSITLRKIFKLH